jgi:hypothetical protein
MLHGPEDDSGGHRGAADGDAFAMVGLSVTLMAEGGISDGGGGHGEEETWRLGDWSEKTRRALTMKSATGYL